MDTSKRKEQRAAYQSKPVVGGVCLIRCSGNQRQFLQETRNVEGLRNRYNFAISIGSPPDPSMRREWETYGGDSFSFTVLEELQKGQDQTDADFRDDLHLLYQIWQEKLSNNEG